MIANYSPIRVAQVDSVEEIISYFPRLVALVKNDQAGVRAEDLLQLFLTCLRSGGVFVARDDHGLCGSCLVEMTSEEVAVLRLLPRETSQGVTKMCLTKIREWGQKNGICELRVCAFKMNGSTFRYFEKTLGFYRQSVIFSMNLNG